MDNDTIKCIIKINNRFILTILLINSKRRGKKLKGAELRRNFNPPTSTEYFGRRM